MKLVKKKQALKLPECVNCKKIFDVTSRMPSTFSCLHLICSECLNKNVAKCPKHASNDQSEAIFNYPLASLINYLSQPEFRKLFEPTNVIDEKLSKISEFLAKSLSCTQTNAISTTYLSPQLERKLLHLLQGSYASESNRRDLTHRCQNVFDRLIIELVQAHYRTKDRIDEFRKAVLEKGCSIENPKVNEFVIEQVLRLFKATNCEASFERPNILNFIAIEYRRIFEEDLSKKHLNRIFQILYKSECFEIINCAPAPCQFKLKLSLVSYEELKKQHDICLMSIAHERKIRLSPEDWSSILFGETSPAVVSKVQSLLDRHQPQVSIDELCEAITLNDKFNIKNFIPTLEGCLKLLTKCNTSQQAIDEQTICAIITSLVDVVPLFGVRRGRTSSIHEFS